MHMGCDVAVLCVQNFASAFWKLQENSMYVAICKPLHCSWRKRRRARRCQSRMCAMRWRLRCGSCCARWRQTTRCHHCHPSSIMFPPCHSRSRMASDTCELQHCASRHLTLLHRHQQERLRAELRKAQQEHQEPGGGDRDGGCAEQRTPDGAAAASSDQVTAAMLLDTSAWQHGICLDPGF